MKKVAVFVPLVLFTIGASALAVIGGIKDCLSGRGLTFNVQITGNSSLVIGSGILKERAFDISSCNVNTIYLYSSGNLIVEQGETNTLVLTADDNLLDLFKPIVTKEKLLLGASDSFQTRNPISYKLTLATPLEHLDVSGSGNVNIKEVNTTSFTCSISGSGDVSIAGGSVARQQVEVSGSGSYNALNLKADHSSVKICGSGTVDVQAEQTLVANISGSGECHYLGTPYSLSKDVCGSGSVHKYK